MKNKLIYFLLGSLFAFLGCFSHDGEEIPQPQEPTLNKGDSLALVKIYQAGDGDNWRYEDWNLEDYMTWGGVSLYLDTLHNEYRVCQLAIFAEDAQGTLSPSIGDLTELRILFITGRKLSGEITKTISKLKYLEELVISNTLMTGGIPGEVFLLPKLKWLNIVNNKLLGGELPEEMTLIERTEGVYDMSNNGLYGKIPEGIRMKYIRLWRNKYTEYPFSYCFQDATAINMQYNRISGEIPDSVLNDKEALDHLESMTRNQEEGCGFSNAPW